MIKLAMSPAGAVGGAATVVAWVSAVAAGVALLTAGVVMLAVRAWCPEPSRPLGGPQAFRGPFCPWVSALGVVVSWLLFAQFSWGSLLCTFWATFGVGVWYFVYGLKHSVGQKSRTWPQLAAATALAASDASTAFDPPSPRPFDGFCTPARTCRSESSNKPRRTSSDGKRHLDSLDAPPAADSSGSCVEGGWRGERLDSSLVMNGSGIGSSRSSSSTNNNNTSSGSRVGGVGAGWEEGGVGLPLGGRQSDGHTSVPDLI